MELSDLLDKIKAHYQAGQPFVVYAPPNSDVITASFQKDDKTYTTDDLTEDGFVFAPFSQEQIILIPNAESDQFSTPFIPSKVKQMATKLPFSNEDRERHIQLVKKSINAIRNKGLVKIVASRRAVVPLLSFDFATIIQRLFGLYESAFRYIWFHPSFGVWAGATPEVLLKLDQKEFSTMALAGTQEHVEGVAPKWGAKELLEQQWVTNDISDKLQKLTSIVKVSNTKNHVAGSLVHLRTDFTGIFSKGGHYLAPAIMNLHPTPAVCGLPRNLAYYFIKKEEGYHREFYTGYLGHTRDSLGSAELYVNLRCMKMNEQEAHLYVGGGITVDSVPELEWEETENKKQTMLQVLAPMLSH